jgi:hypothetical protein
MQPAACMQDDPAMTAQVETRDDERVQWLPMIAAISAISVVGIAIGLGMPLLSVILETRGYSASMIGLNTAIAGIASIAAAPLATPLAARFGVAWTMLAMITTGALAFTGFYFVPYFWMWFPLRALLHLSLTVLFILSEFWISTSAPPHRRGLVLGIYATVLSLGFAACRSAPRWRLSHSPPSRSLQRATKARPFTAMVRRKPVSCATSGWCPRPPPRFWCSARSKQAALPFSRFTEAGSDIPRPMRHCF